MTSKNFTLYFLFSALGLMAVLLGFNLIIDPYGVTNTNLLKIKYKLTRDGRAQKINRIKEIKHIDNLILGSSRSERLNPATVSNILGGYSYSFGIGGANIEDELGLLLYLEKENKLPKNIILFLDFSAFNVNFATPTGFFNTPELNFIKKNKMTNNYMAKIFSVKAVKASVKTFKAHLKNKVPKTYIDDNGFLQSQIATPSGQMERIKKVADEYNHFSYQEGNIQFSEQRFEYLKRFVTICERHKINLHILLTPVHSYLYEIIEKNVKLERKLQEFKNTLSKITPYCDAMIKSAYIMDDYNFEDAVHYNTEMGDLLLLGLLENQPSNICTKRYGAIKKETK